MTTNSIETMGLAKNQGIWAVAPWFSRIVMAPPIFIMVLVSVRCIFNPTHAIASTGVTLSTPEAITDTRVMGGLSLTLAFVIASAIFSRGSLRMGHATVVALMAFVLAVRMFGFMLDGTTLAMGDQKVKTIGEIVFLTLNSVGLIFQTYLVKQTRVTQ